MPCRTPILALILAIGAALAGPALALAAQMPPGTSRDPAVHARLEAAFAAKGATYQPRTHLWDGSQPRHLNRLIEAASPYLLQHAHNPVDWHPWSEATLTKAKAMGLPIFLSVGYATCHWCHVMEEESFDNEAIAARLNARFLPVKVDREERPDIDHLYLTATQLQTGQAGWPNSVFLMPDGRPFHTAGYLPPDVFGEMLDQIGATWDDPAGQAEIAALSDELTDAVQRITQMMNGDAVVLDRAVFDQAAGTLLGMHNALEGGFSDTQQFPRTGYLLYLLDHWRRTGDEASLHVVLETLDAIVAGGIHDHVGGGFHRYTVDPNWRTPHFEKMLYTQARLARVLIEAWQITGTPAYRRAALRSFDYVARDMRDPGGAFFAAEDADSLDAHGARVEGAFYVWDRNQADAAVGPQAADALGLAEPPTLDAGAVIHLDPFSPSDFTVLDPALAHLRALRDQRPRPLRDDKVIAGWNGLMIRALAQGAVAFESPNYADHAAQAGEALWTRLWDGRALSRLWLAGRARETGTLRDYVWLALGYLALADATGDSLWHDRAMTLAQAAWQTFADGAGRLKYAALDGPLGPIYDNTDGALPSGESAALELFARLARRTGDPLILGRAEQLRAALSAPLARAPLLRPAALTASRILDMGATGRPRLAARGTVVVDAVPGQLTLRIAPGWHLNANQPGQDWLIGASVTGAEAAWPPGHAMSLGFADQPITVYEGDLTVPLGPPAGATLSVEIQACSDEICLPPETVTFRLHGAQN